MLCYILLVLTVKAGCYQSPEVLGFSRRFRGLGTTSLLFDSVMTYASRLHATPFFAPHVELNTLQLLHMLIMYVYISLKKSYSLFKGERHTLRGSFVFKSSKAQSF
jgi:hypothetical protein